MTGWSLLVREVPGSANQMTSMKLCSGTAHLCVRCVLVPNIFLNLVCDHADSICQKVSGAQNETNIFD